jgi:hypothetical protein
MPLDFSYPDAAEHPDKDCTHVFNITCVKECHDTLLRYLHGTKYVTRPPLLNCSNLLMNCIS